VTVMKVGIIGCGNIAKVHAWALSGIAGVRLTAFCDIHKEKAETFAERYANADDIIICDDYRDLFKSDVDAVHICTPHYLHARMAVDLLDHGKAVFMEKPCAISIEQFEALKQAEKRNPGKLGFCFQNRYNKSTEMIDALISEGKIGSVIGGRAFVTWRRDEDYYMSSDWKGYLSTEGGGALINQSIHTLDLLLRYLGEPDEVKGSVHCHHLCDIEVEDTVEAWMSFPDGKRACFYASNGYSDDAPVILEIQGDKGRIMLSGPDVFIWNDAAQCEVIRCDEQSGIGKGYWGSGHKACIEDFYSCLMNHKAYINNLHSVENTFSVVMKIYDRKIY